MKQLSNKEIRELSEQIMSTYNIELFAKKDNLKVIDNIVYRGDIPIIFYHDNKPVPTLKLLQENNFLKKVTIDMPAVKFIVGGADVMRPGIVEMEDFSKEQIISVIDQRNKKPLAVGIALLDSSEITAMDKGKVIKNIHYVGDKVWMTTMQT